jgi:hypothetical protein
VDKAQVQLYRRRWKEVWKVEQKEIQSSTLEIRWQQLNAAFGLGKGLHLHTRGQDEMRVYQRWAKLKGSQDRDQHLKV